MLRDICCAEMLLMLWQGVARTWGMGAFFCHNPLLWQGLTDSAGFGEVGGTKAQNDVMVRRRNAAPAIRAYRPGGGNRWDAARVPSLVWVERVGIY